MWRLRALPVAGEQSGSQQVDSAVQRYAFIGELPFDPAVQGEPIGNGLPLASRDLRIRQPDVHAFVNARASIRELAFALLETGELRNRCVVVGCRHVFCWIGRSRVFLRNPCSASFKSSRVAADNAMTMAISKLPDLDALAIELVQLERRELEISALRRKLHDRLNSFPNEFTLRRERELSDERRAIHRRIDELKALLAPLRRV
jgi:hypothetical protein